MSQNKKQNNDESKPSKEILEESWNEQLIGYQWDSRFQPGLVKL